MALSFVPIASWVLVGISALILSALAGSTIAAAVRKKKESVTVALVRCTCFATLLLHSITVALSLVGSKTCNVLTYILLYPVVYPLFVVLCSLSLCLHAFSPFFLSYFSRALSLSILFSLYLSLTLCCLILCVLCA